MSFLRLSLQSLTVFTYFFNVLFVLYPTETVTLIFSLYTDDLPAHIDDGTVPYIL